MLGHGGPDAHVAGVGGVSVRGCLPPRRGVGVARAPKPRSRRASAPRAGPRRRSRPPRRGPSALAKGAPRPPDSSPATGPTPPRWASSCSACSAPSASGPTSRARSARRSPTAPARSSAGPGWRSRSRASPSRCCCSGRGVAPRRRRRRRSAPRSPATPPERPAVRIAIGALLLFVADVGILHLAYGQPALDGSLDDLRNAGRCVRRRDRRSR